MSGSEDFDNIYEACNAQTSSEINETSPEQTEVSENVYEAYGNSKNEEYERPYSEDAYQTPYNFDVKNIGQEKLASDFCRRLCLFLRTKRRGKIILLLLCVTVICIVVGVVFTQFSECIKVSSFNIIKIIRLAKYCILK